MAEFDDTGKVISIEEKPVLPKSDFAITGMYFYDEHASEHAKSIEKSKRGELEITDLNKIYLKQNQLNVEKMGRGYTWLDTGTHESLIEASQFVQTIEKRQGLKIACLEEIALKKNWISAGDVEEIAKAMLKNNYGKYLMQLIKEKKNEGN